jgi:mycofactocin precursor
MPDTILPIDSVPVTGRDDQSPITEDRIEQADIQEGYPDTEVSPEGVPGTPGVPLEVQAGEIPVEEEIEEELIIEDFTIDGICGVY